MACRVRYLNSAGIHMREIPGIDALARAFPSQWIFYASLQCFPPRSYPIEIDAFVITDERALLLELKDYNGTLAANGDQWILNESRRFRSPVDIVSEKARKVKGILGSTVPGFSKYSVDSRVVLTGTSTKDGLPAPEQTSVLSLEEACSLADPTGRAKVLGPAALHLKKAPSKSFFDSIGQKQSCRRCVTASHATQKSGLSACGVG
jgi:hypothetical protein